MSARTDSLVVAEQILELFPLQDLPERKADDSEQEKKTNRLSEIQQSSTLRKSEPVKDGDDVTRLGEYYRRYRTVDELSKEARAFYEAAGEFRANWS
jgi:RNA polymerase I-specific transcription initiation factor RRN7